MDSIDIACVCAFVFRARKRRIERKYWVHPMLSQRLISGQFYKIYSYLREDDKNYYRMSIQSFDNLLNRIGNRLTYQTTNLRLHVPPEERLSVTIR